MSLQILAGIMKMCQYLKIVFCLCVILQLFQCKSKEEKLTRDEAAHVMNVIDSSRRYTSDPPDDLARYLVSINKQVSQKQYNIRITQVDSLEDYYRKFISTNKEAIKNVSLLKSNKSSDSLKESVS